MMFLQKIHRNKVLQAVISVILCIVMMFCVVSKPFEVKVNAIAGLDDAIFWAIVAALLQFGIVIEVSNPEARQAVADFFWSLTDQLRDEIGIAAAFWRQGYSVYYDWAVESWSNIAQAISDWFTTERYPQSSIIYGNVSASNNAVDFYTYKSLRFDFPALPSKGFSTVVFPVNNCTFTFYINPPWSLYYSIVGDYDSDERLALNRYACVIAPNDSNVRLVTRDTLDSYFDFENGGSYYSGVLSSFYASDGYRYGFMFDRGDTGRVIFQALSDQYSCFVFGDTYSQLRCMQSNSSTVAFLDRSNNPINDMTFSNGLDALVWFFDQCGIDVRNGSSSVYTAPEQTVANPVDIDPATIQTALNNIESLPADSTVPVILPGTETQYRQLVSSVPVSSLYDADIKMPTVDGNLWKTKFPFCIPFDLINLFSGFSAEAQAPSFHVLVMPANSFGLDNDDIYWDIDFQPYNYLVQILRFFLALGFVLWLIVQTRKLIRG